MFKYLFDFFTVSGKEPLQINRIKFAFQFFLVFCFLFSKPIGSFLWSDIITLGNGDSKPILVLLLSSRLVTFPTLQRWTYFCCHIFVMQLSPYSHSHL